MDIELARTMVRTAFDANRALHSILPLLQAGLPEADYRSSAHDIAVAVDQVNTALLARAIAAHPALEQEIDTAISERGRY
jgi:hypothetical protein